MGLYGGRALLKGMYNMKKLAIIALCVILLSSSLFGCDQAEESKTDISECVSETGSEAPPEQSEEVSDDVSVEVSELTFTIVDKRDGQNGCWAEAIDEFFEDDNFTYYFSDTPMSEYIIVKYSDGTTQNVKEALADGNITIEDLDRFGIKYLKYSKSTGDLVE